MVKNIPIGEIELNKGQVEGLPKNPRFIKDYRFEALKKSIQDAPEMLSLRELIVYPHGGKYVVIGGNMRLRACKELGYKEVPCKVLDEQTPADKLREYTIKDNNAFGDTDFDLLANEWDTDELGDWGVEFPTAEIDDLGDAGEPDEVEEVEIPENVETRCKKGDIWQLGNHRLVCGDSTDAGTIALLMNGEKADLCFTSPPYNVMKDFHNKHIKDESAYLKEGTYEEYEDNLTDEEYYNFLQKALDNALNNADDVMFNIGCCKGALIGTATLLGNNADKFKGIITWKKTGAFMPFFPAQYGLIANITEPIYCFSNSGQRKFAHPNWKEGEAVYNLIETANASGNEYSDLNAATFPVELPANVIKQYSKKSVIDIFGGSGTTLIAAEQLGRKCFMCELSEKECDVILARWEKLTGKTATKVEEHNE